MPDVSCTFQKVSYTSSVRIEILPTATWHSITGAEIRAIINHYELRLQVTSRLRADIPTDPYFHVGRPQPTPHRSHR
jgi:hypothetical protein